MKLVTSKTMPKTTIRMMGGDYQSMFKTMRKVGTWFWINEEIGEELLDTMLTEWISSAGCPTGVRVQIIAKLMKDGMVCWQAFIEYGNGKRRPAMGYRYESSEFLYRLNIRDKFLTECQNDSVKVVSNPALVRADEEIRHIQGEFYQLLERKDAIDWFLKKENKDRVKKGLRPIRELNRFPTAREKEPEGTIHGSINE